MSLKIKRLSSEDSEQRNVNHLPFGRISQTVKRGGQESDLSRQPAQRRHGVSEKDRNQHFLLRMPPFHSSPTKGIFDFNGSRPMYDNRTDSQLGLITSGTVIRNEGIAFTQTRFSRDDLPHPNKLRRKSSNKRNPVSNSWPGKNGVSSHINNLHRKQRSDHQDSPFSVTPASSLASSAGTPFELWTASANKTSQSSGSHSQMSNRNILWNSQPQVSHCCAVRTTPLQRSLVPHNSLYPSLHLSANLTSPRAARFDSPSSVWSAPQPYQRRQPLHNPSNITNIMNTFSFGSTGQNNFKTVHNLPSRQVQQEDLLMSSQQAKSATDNSSPNLASDSPTFTYQRRRSEE